MMEVNNSSFSSNDTTWEQEVGLCGRYPSILDTVVASMMFGGLAGNILAFRTLGKLKRQNVTTYLLRGLAVADICVLITFFGVFCFGQAGHLSPTIVATPRVYLMGLLRPIFHIIIMVDIWTTVVVGMNRYIALCRPLEAATLCTTHRARKHMIGIVLLSVAYGIPAFVDVIFPTTWFHYIYELGFNIMFRFLTPFCMLLFFCVRIIIALRATRRQQLGRYGGQQVDRKFTSMLLLLLGIFLVCHAYIWIVYLVLKLLPSSLHMQLVYVGITNNGLYILNSSVNFLIYLAYIKEFRRVLCFRCKYCSPRIQDYELS